MIKYLFFLSLLFIGCKTSKYNEGLLHCVDNISSGNYDACYKYFQVENASDTLKIDAILSDYRHYILSEFGKKLQFTQISVTQNDKHRTIDGKKISNPYIYYFEVSNKQKFSAIKIITDSNHRIQSFDIQKEPTSLNDLPNIWLSGCIMMILCIGVNIIVLIQVLKSRITNKWLKIISIIFINYPIIGYHSIAGITMNFLNIQILGAGFGINGYSDSHWEIGVPISAIYIYWKLRNNLYRTKDDDLFYQQNG